MNQGRDARVLADWIRARDDIAIIPHVSPDGDALGSALALQGMIKALGKRAVVVSEDPVPDMYRFMPGASGVVTASALPFQPRALLFDDVAAMDRAGDKGLLTPATADWALIDHHETNGGFAPVSLIDGDAPATGVLVMRVMDALGVAPDRDMAVNLYTAIATDTGNFSFSNTTPESFECAARLLRTGFPLEDINYCLFRERTVARTKLIGLALSAMEFYAGGRVAITRIPQSMFLEAGAGYQDTEGIINFLVEMEGVEVAMTVESRDGGATTKFSLRSSGDIDVSRIAYSFHGGGHKNAAGMNIAEPPETAAARALEAVLAALEG